MEVVGGGESAPNAGGLPIDIPFAKTVEWLVERRVLSKGSYQKALRTVHAKVAAALAEERPDCPGIAEVLPPGIEQEKVSYASCCSVLELLKAGGLLAEKSFLGSYTNPHAARWADIVKRYEAGSIFLVDMAQGLVHNCTYELPAIKKDMGRAQKELHELERKQAEYNRLADGGRQRFQEMCDRRHMAPCGHDEIATQLRLTIVQLKPVYERVGRLCQAAAAVEACAFYRRFVLFCLDQARAAEPPPTEEAARPKGGKGKKDAAAEKAAPVALMGEAEAGASCMAQLQRVQALTLGDEAPTLAGAGAAGAASGGAVAEVDWGDADEGGAAPPAEVDWGAEIDGGAATGVVEVDWGGDGGEVDWGGDAAGAGGDAIEVDWGGDSDAATGWGGLIEVEEGDDGECGGLSAILEDAAERNKLMSELLELAGFYKQRVAEGSSDGLPAELALEPAELAAYAQAAEAAHADLDAAHTQHLLLMQASPAYEKRQVEVLRQQLDRADKMSGLADDLRTRQAELQMTISEAQPQYEAVAVAVRRGKVQLETALSKHFKGTKVNLMGEINNI